MESRKKVGIYIDYSIRIPSFKQSYTLFKESLFKDHYGLSKVVDEEFTEKEIKSNLQNDNIRFFWDNQMKDKDVTMFYSKLSPSKIKDREVVKTFSNWFYNEEHYRKFIDEYSFNVYSDCEVASKKDVDIINIAQSELFDITLIDEVISPRKISNTFHFLSKNRLFPQSVLFLYEKQELNKDSYFAIWNPKENLKHRNADKSELFLNWMKDLETKNKQ